MKIEEHADRIEYLNDEGLRHRTDGPAVIFPNGTEYWYQNGLRHRIDGPAIIFPEGAKFWHQNGQYHRTDGPAVIDHYGIVYYYISNKDVTDKVNSLMEQGLSDVEALEILML